MATVCKPTCGAGCVESDFIQPLISDVIKLLTV